MVKASEFRDMTREELIEAERSVSRELFEMRNEWMGSKKIEKHRLRQKRKDRARMLTILTEKWMNKQVGR